MSIGNRYAVTAIIVGFLLAGFATEPRTDPQQPIEFDNLTFHAPAGEDWQYDRDDSDEIPFVLFQRGGSGSPAFGVMVWQERVDEPVNSEDDIWTGLLEPYQDAYDTQEGNEIRKTDCNPDQTLTAMGLLCQVEGRLGYWARTADGQATESEGHVYAFVLPHDNREVVVIEYFQQLVPGVPPVDTRQLLAEFVRNITLH